MERKLAILGMVALVTTPMTATGQLQMDMMTWDGGGGGGGTDHSRDIVWSNLTVNGSRLGGETYVASSGDGEITCFTHESYLANGYDEIEKSPVAVDVRWSCNDEYDTSISSPSIALFSVEEQAESCPGNEKCLAGSFSIPIYGEWGGTLDLQFETPNQVWGVVIDLPLQSYGRIQGTIWTGFTQNYDATLGVETDSGLVLDSASHLVTVEDPASGTEFLAQEVEFTDWESESATARSHYLYNAHVGRFENATDPYCVQLLARDDGDSDDEPEVIDYKNTTQDNAGDPQVAMSGGTDMEPVRLRYGGQGDCTGFTVTKDAEQVGFGN